MLSFLWQAVAPLLQSLSCVNNSQHSSCSPPPPGFIFIQAQEGHVPVGHLAPSVQGWPAQGKPQGSLQDPSSEAPLRTGAGRSFFFLLTPQFLLSGRFVHPPFTPRLSSGHCGQSAGRRASHPRQPFTHGLGSRIYLSCTQHCLLVFGRAEPSLHTLHGCHQPRCRS